MSRLHMYEAWHFLTIFIRVFCFIVYIHAFSNPVRSDERPLSRFSLPEIRTNIEKMQSHLKQSPLYIQYRMDAVTQLRQAENAFPWIEITFAMHQSENKYYCEYCAPQRGKSNVLPRKSAFDGRIATNLVSSSGQILSRQIGVYWLDIYVQQLGFPYRPNDVKRAKVDNTDLYWLPEAFDKNRYQVLDRQELVDGTWCHVVMSPELDTLWFDASRGFVLLQRELRFAPGKPLKLRIQNHQLREIEPGFWLPLHSIRDDFGSVNDPDAVNKVILSQSIQVKAIEIRRNLPESFYRLAFPDGTHIDDDINDVRYQMLPPGVSSVEYAVQQVLQDIKPKESMFSRFILALVLLINEVILIGYVLRKGRTHSSC